MSQQASCKWNLPPESMLHKLDPWDCKPSSLRAQEETQETLQKLNSTAQRNLGANKHPKLSGKTLFPHKSLPASDDELYFYQSKLSPPWLPTWRLGALSRLGKRKQPWTLSWFHGPVLYGDLLFSCASHFQSSQPPSYPPKLPSPNNRLKAIQLSPLYSMHFIFSLPCTSSLTAPAIGSGGWRTEAVEGWVVGGDFFGGALAWPGGVPHASSQGLEMSNPCESLTDTWSQHAAEASGRKPTHHVSKPPFIWCQHFSMSLSWGPNGHFPPPLLQLFKGKKRLDNMKKTSLLWQKGGWDGYISTLRKMRQRPHPHQDVLIFSPFSPACNASE